MNTFFFDDVQYPEGLFGGKDFFNPIIYSTEEREIGVWTDNKPLYQKTYILQSPIIINNSGTNINSYITNAATIEQITNAEACNSTANLQTSNIFVGKSNNNLLAYCAEAGSFDVITLTYTKTTDVAGSGQYNTLGVPTVHYSTDEQVIGTWIDGKPLYQKTYSINETIYNQDKSIDVSSLNIDKYVSGEGTFMRNVNWASPVLYIDTPFNLYESSGNRSYLRYGRTNKTIDYGVFLGNNETATDITFTIKYTKNID